MKILHIENPAGVATMLARGERALGHVSAVLETWPSSGGYEHDFHILYDGNLLNVLGRMRDVVNLARDFDIIHAHGGLARRRIDYEVMARWLKKPIVVHYHGSESRLGYGMHHKRIVAAKIVATPDLLRYHEDAEFIPNPMEVLDAPRFRGAVRFVHLPTNRQRKGTEAILGAVARLRDEGREFDFKLVEGRPHSEALVAMKHSDVVVDQVTTTLDGAPAGLLGVTSLEGMAMGKCVVNSMSADGFGKFYPKKYPGVYADEASVHDTLAWLTNDPEYARAAGARSRSWIEENLTPEIIARRTVAVYERALAGVGA